MSDADVRVEITSFAAQEQAITTVRTQVFHHEQQINPALDFDGWDAIATQVIASIQGQVVGTARIRMTEDSAKIERVAVLASHRNRGVGTAMMVAILRNLEQEGIKNIILNAQRPSIAFYQRLGFLPCGDSFMEAGIEHIQMFWSQNTVCSDGETP